MISLSPDLQIAEVEYANQGNAILGIRDSGKSYTATWFAERLLNASIPFVAFDPIGVWRNLKLPGKAGKGYEVVVAGDDGDIPLSPESAPEIVRAAMKENIPLVIDLYSMSLSKADWKRIVETCVRILLFENKQHGLRHIFIEEAAEFAPQRVGPDVGRVYAEIEKLARMGGNAGLGYTLINQRAEEVNKAVLELCDCLFLHRQKGRHSLTALGKWLDAADATGSREIIKSLPSLEQGECWAWPQGRRDPVRIRIPAKRSFHPDRRNLAATSGAITGGANVSGFVDRLTKAIDADEAAAPGGAKPVKLANLESAARVGELLTRIDQLETQCLQMVEETRVLQDRANRNRGNLRAIVQHCSQLLDADGAGLPQFVDGQPTPIAQSPSEDVERRVHRHGMGIPPAVQRSIDARKDGKKSAPTSVKPPITALSEPLQRVLSSLAFWKSVGHEQPTRPQVAAVAGYSPNTGNFRAILGSLGAAGHVSIPSTGRVSLRAGAPVAGLSPEQARDRMMQILSAPEQKLLRAALKRPHGCSRGELADATGYSANTGNFRALIGSLCTLGILTKPGAGRVAVSTWAREVIA